MSRSNWIEYSNIRYPIGPENPKKKTNVKKVLVVGGAGYIGSMLVRKLLQKGYKVRVLDILLYGDESILSLYDNPNFEFCQGDFRDRESVVRCAKDVDAVIHLGAIVGDEACRLDPQLTLEVNSAATKMIKQVCVRLGVKRFIFASTCSVYGANDNIINEKSVLNPLSIYAMSKRDAEQAIFGTFDGNCCWTILRLATAFGASYRPRFDLVINLLTAVAFFEKNITIFGGRQWRPFIHVLDIAKAFIICLEAPMEVVDKQIFNVGANHLNCQILKIGEMIACLVPFSSVEHRQDAKDNRSYQVSFDKIRNLLGFTCDKGIQDGILEIKDALQSGLIDNYREPKYNNYRWLEKLIEKRELFAKRFLGKIDILPKAISQPSIAICSCVASSQQHE